MKLWTYGEAKLKIQRDLDLLEETFIGEEEMLSYFNDAIDEAEAEIHNLFEDYFLTEADITLVNGTDRYSMPADIYANKIRFLWYNDGQSRYQIKRTRERAVPYADLASCYYSFQIQHRDPVEGITIKLSPPVKQDGMFVHMQYLRNANRLVLDADVIDIPESLGFIFAFVKEKVYSKETHPLLASAQAQLEKQRLLLKVTLQSMTVDDDTEIEPDMSFYLDMN
jgi:hypothetical protein